MNTNNISRILNYNGFSFYSDLNNRSLEQIKGKNPYKRICNELNNHSEENRNTYYNMNKRRNSRLVNSDIYKSTETKRSAKINHNDIENSLKLLNKDFNKDIINISNHKKTASCNRINSLSIDKGTASHTTIYVDNKTFNSIVSNTGINGNPKWDELGIDGEKRWVVINGQRFQCPLSEKEKEAYRKASKGYTLLDALKEHEEATEKLKGKKEKHPSLSLSLNSKNNLSISGDKNLKDSLKIKNLENNKPVMKLLKDVLTKSGSLGINLSI